MEALTIVAGSWPIAVMVFGVTALIVIRGCVRRGMRITEQQNEYRASTAVTVRRNDD